MEDSLREGGVYGSLTVVRIKRVRRGIKAICRCECGDLVEVSGSRLLAKTQGIKRSCGKRKCNRRFANPSGFAVRIHKGYRDILINRRWMREHRFVLQKHLDRQLLPSEHVHHINGDRLDNRIENLEIMDQSRHSKEHAAVLQELDRLRAENRQLRKLLASDATCSDSPDTGSIAQSLACA